MINKAADQRQKLVILGAGFASYRLALGISTALFDVTVVSPRNHFLFTPLLASTTVGTVEFRSIIEPIRFTDRSIKFLQAHCERVDTGDKSIFCRSSDRRNEEFPLPYDLLVVGVGATTRTFGIPGAERYAFMLKELTDARNIRQRVIQRFEEASLPQLSEQERARLLHFVVVGGGPTGVEFAGELYDYLSQDLKRYYADLARLCHITLLEASDTLLSSFDRNLGAYTQRIFRRQKIEVRTSALVTAVNETEIQLSDGSKIPYGLLVWSAGIGPTSLIVKLPWKKDSAERLITDEFLRVSDLNGVYAVGDCAVIPDRKYPLTGQLAQQQGKYLAAALNRSVKGGKVKPFRYIHLGMLAYIGGHKALADTPGVKWRGFVAWLMWRSIYITKLVSFRNKVRVLFDWFKTTIFGRDVSTF